MKAGIIKEWKVTKEIETVSGYKIPTEAEFTIDFGNIKITIITSDAQIKNNKELLEDANKHIRELIK